MNREEIMALSGRELDAEVAEKVIGEKPRWKRPGFQYGGPAYSTSISAAWEVVEKMLDNAGIDLEISICINRKWNINIMDDGQCISSVQEANLQVAICRAALLALEGR